ncbi:MAG TPA: ABC-type transport auxiliary lipoprotein family protein [Gammaproteobacteria bacterium]|nr:ABC-type transport auxiliary lipoprotein family protein [Gammaproteobacteria bacterium]
MIKKLALALVPPALLLAGCFGGSQPVLTEHFTLAGTPPTQTEQVAAPAEAGAANGPILRIAEINAPHWLDTTNLYYRLAYRNDAKISAYSRSDWVAPPTVLLGGVLQTTLAHSGRWKAILGPSDVTQADVALRVELNDFEQTFTSAGQSAGVLDATVTIVSSEGNRILAQRHFHIEKPAPSADAAGGVKALSEASRAFATKVRDWLGEVTATTDTARNPASAE